MTYQANINVEPQMIQDMIITAFEGGSNYWLGRGRVELINPPYADLPDDGVAWYGNSQRNVFAEPDFKITIETEEGLKTLDADAITRGLAAMPPRHLADLTSDNGDAETADVFLQCALFGEVVYG